MSYLRVTYFNSPWSIASVTQSPRGGGWPSVRALQASNLCKYRRHIHTSYIDEPCRAEKIERGVYVTRRTLDGIWRPYFKLELVDSI